MFSRSLRVGITRVSSGALDAIGRGSILCARASLITQCFSLFLNTLFPRPATRTLRDSSVSNRPFCRRIAAANQGDSPQPWPNAR